MKCLYIATNHYRNMFKHKCGRASTDAEKRAEKGRGRSKGGKKKREKKRERLQRWGNKSNCST